MKIVPSDNEPLDALLIKDMSYKEIPCFPLPRASLLELMEEDYFIRKTEPVKL